MWQSRQFEERAVASYGYQTVLDQLINNNMQAPAQTINEPNAVVPAPYAYMEKLLAAEIAVEQQDIEQSVTDLQQVVNTTEDPFVKELATIRLARVYLAQDQAQLALDLLPLGNKHAIDRAEWAITRAEALTALEKFDDARAAYGEIILLYPEYSPQREMASMLLADLPAE